MTPLHGVDALRATRPVHLLHVATLTETRALLQAVGDVEVRGPVKARLRPEGFEGNRTDNRFAAADVSWR